MLQNSALRSALRRYLGAACIAALSLGSAAFAQIADLRQAAEAGNPEAQLALAQAYDQGTEVPQDFVQAEHWFRLAAEAGDARAQNRLGRYLRAGLAGAADPVEAVAWLARAAATGAPQYLFDLATMYEAGAGVAQDLARAAVLYGTAAAAGHQEASVSLGVLYQQGLGVAQDFARAKELYQGAAEAGNARAQNNLGLLYTRGDGVEQDYAAAAHWFGLAAEAGFGTAMTNLGRLYENGFGVPLDETIAADLYRRAGADRGAALLRDGPLADPYLAVTERSAAAMAMIRTGAGAGDPLAQLLLAETLISGQPELRQPFEAAKLFRAAAQKGIGSAMANLGVLYFKGQGVPQDYVLGYMWLSLASTAGYADAAPLRDGLLALMTVAQAREAQEMALAWIDNRKANMEAETLR